jgi:hypothetical protein
MVGLGQGNGSVGMCGPFCLIQIQNLSLLPSFDVRPSGWVAGSVVHFEEQHQCFAPHGHG